MYRVAQKKGALNSTTDGTGLELSVRNNASFISHILCEKNEKFMQKSYISLYFYRHILREISLLWTVVH